jgi:DNA-binding transcriptional regulator PaaX
MSRMNSKNTKIYPTVNGRKPHIQKAILKILAEKNAVKISDLKGKDSPKKTYAMTRCTRNLVDLGYAEIHSSDNQDYLKITKKGRVKLNSLKLEGEEILVPAKWDGFWRIVILDIPEERKNEREALRYLLKKANFVCVKNTVWISPLPYENLFTNLKKDLGLSTEIMIIVTDKLDPETNIAFLKAMKE